MLKLWNVVYCVGTETMEIWGAIREFSRLQGEKEIVHDRIKQVMENLYIEDVLRSFCTTGHIGIKGF